MLKYIISTIIILSSYSIPKDDINDQKIYYGNPNNFEKLACINYNKIVQNTEEYRNISNNNIEYGTAKYWTYISQASNKAKNNIKNYAKESEYDLILECDYVNDLDLEIECINITEIILEFSNPEDE